MSLFSRGPHTISPTAHYTGYVWSRNGLAPEGFATPEGFVLYHASRPLSLLAGAFGGPAVEEFLLARHRIIDARLERAITEGRVGQVVEVAAGMSPRGQRFAARHGDALTYVEADLPGMATRKRDALRLAGLGGEHHRVVDVDALREDDGPGSLAAIAATLDPSVGTAIVTEGLLNYLAPDAVAGLWRRFATTLGAFPHGLYLSDLHLEEGTGPLTSFAARGLGLFVRGDIHFHHADAAAAETALRDAGFASAAVRPPADFAVADGGTDGGGAQAVRIVEATTG